MQRLALRERDLRGDIAGNASRKRTAIGDGLADDEFERERFAVAPMPDVP